MARQDNHARTSAAQPDWKDVGNALRAVELSWEGHCEVCIDVEGARNVSGAVWVYVKLWDGWAPARGTPTHVARSLWPTVSCKTMAALVFRLIHQVDHMADAAARAQAEGLPF